MLGLWVCATTPCWASQNCYLDLRQFKKTKKGTSAKTLYLKKKGKQSAAGTSPQSTQQEPGEQASLFTSKNLLLCTTVLTEELG